MSAQNQAAPTVDEFAGMKVVDILRSQREISIHGKALTDEERRELRDHGKILSGQERRQVNRDLTNKETARKAGVTCASEGGKQSANPHPGGSHEWWGWHEGYKATRAKQEAEKRRTPK